MKRIKVCLVLPPYLPVPATRGGAVETLAEDLIRINEERTKLEIDCISVYNRRASRLFSRYPSTHFLTLRVCNNYFFDFLLKCLNYIGRKVLGVNVREKIRIRRYQQLILTSHADYYVFEGVNPYVTSELVKSVGKEKMILHIHKDTKPNQSFEEMFQNFIGISQFVSNRFCMNGIIPKERVYTLYNGIDFCRFNKSTTNEEIMELRKKYSINKEDMVILYTGRLLPEKGIKELVLAFKKMKNKSQCKLVIVGSAVSGSNMDTSYTLEVKNLAKNENIIFTGYVPNDKLYKYYKMAEMAIFPSTGEEGFGLVLVEAMCSKLPIIITNSGAMNEIATEENAIEVELNSDLIVNLSEAMVRLSTDSNLRKKMGEASFRLSQKFSAENYYNGYVDILTKLKNGG